MTNDTEITFLRSVAEMTEIGDILRDQIAQYRSWWLTAQESAMSEANAHGLESAAHQETRDILAVEIEEHRKDGVALWNAIVAKADAEAGVATANAARNLALGDLIDVEEEADRHLDQIDILTAKIDRLCDQLVIEERARTAADEDLEATKKQLRIVLVKNDELGEWACELSQVHDVLDRENEVLNEEIVEVSGDYHKAAARLNVVRDALAGVEKINEELATTVVDLRADIALHEMTNRRFQAESDEQERTVEFLERSLRASNNECEKRDWAVTGW